MPELVAWWWDVPLVIRSRLSIGPLNSSPAPNILSYCLALPADPRWSSGEAKDLRACLKDDRDGEPATIEGILAGELPRRVWR